MRINGIGVTLLGVGPMDPDGVAPATMWFTFLYLPLVPLTRYRVRFLPHKGSGFSYQVLSHEPLNWREVLKTYFVGWVLTPLILFGPLAIGVEEVWSGIGLPASLHLVYIAMCIAWLIVAVWRLADRQEAMCRPPGDEA